MTTALTAVNDQPIQPRQADTDAQLIGLWLHGRSPHTARAYRADARRFLDLLGKPLASITLADLQSHADALDADGLRPATRHRQLSAIKSLFAFASRIGYLRFDVARPLRLPAIRDRLSERILSESEVQRMIALESDPRNHAMLLLFYGAGIRVSELTSLKWRDLQPRDPSGQASVWGKGGKGRVILLPASVWTALQSLRSGESDDEAPVFMSRQGKHLDPSQAWRIVRAAAKRAGVAKEVSCHWLRHAHASHAIDRNCPLSLVSGTLGHSSCAVTSRYVHARPNDSSSRFLPL
jgi:integrase/recombinase XerD